MADKQVYYVTIACPSQDEGRGIIVTLNKQEYDVSEHLALYGGYPNPYLVMVRCYSDDEMQTVYAELSQTYQCNRLTPV